MEKIKIKHFATILFFVSAMFYGCEKDSWCNCLEGTGDTKTEIRTVDAFTDIEVNKNIKLLLVYDSVYYVKVSAGKNLLDGISTKVTDNELIIENINRCNWLRSFKNHFVVEVHTPVLNHITYNASDDVVMMNRFYTDSLLLDCHDGSGEIYLNVNTPVMWTNLHTGLASVTATGRVGVNYVYAAGQGYINYSTLSTGYTFIQNKGTNDCRVLVEKEILAEIYYVGNIYYSGNPYKVTSVVSGDGRLIHQP